jgi:hypothetical protein
LDDVTLRPAPHTEGARYPFWSPNGNSIAFFADFQLKRLDLADGSVRPLAGAGNGSGGTWNRHDVILYSPLSSGGLSRVSASGGDRHYFTELQSLQVGHTFPHFFADDEHFLFFVNGPPNVSGLYLGDLKGSAPRRFMAADAAGTIAGEYVYAIRQTKLVAQRFDLTRLQAIGDASVIADQVLSDPSGRSAAVSASSTGVIAYRSGTPSRRQLVWVDRTGQPLMAVGDVEEVGAVAQAPEISPDGKYVAVIRTIDENRDVWTWDLTRGTPNRITSAPGAESQPVWSPDNALIAFQSTRDGPGNLYQRAANGSGKDVPLLLSPEVKGVGGWSPDQKLFLFNMAGRNGWVLPLTGNGTPIPVTDDLPGVRQTRFSPDGKWISFEANSSGRYEAFVQPFPGPGRRVQISRNGGVSIRWAGNSRELFFLSPDGILNAVPLKVAADGSADPGIPVPLFKPRLSGSVLVAGPGAFYYAVAPDGQRFLVSATVGEVHTPPITIVLNRRPPL